MTTAALNPADLIRDLQRKQTQAGLQRAARADRFAEIESGLRLLHPEAGSVVEIRVLGIPGKGRPYTSSGYFDDFSKAAECVLWYDDRESAGVYLTLNEIAPALLARSPNTMTDYPGHTTTDAEVLRRRWLFVDVDPHRPAGVASTDEEMDTAVELVHETEAKLKEFGFPEPLIGRSGNGCLLLYRIDLPNTPEIADLIGRFYRGLNSQLGTVAPARPYSSIDTTVSNAARIIRVPGSTNRKGVNTPDRPHRRAELFEAVEPIQVVTQASIEAVAALAPQPDHAGGKSAYNQKRGDNGKARFNRLDVAKYLTEHGIDHKVKKSPGRTIYTLACPFDPNHGRNGETAVIQNGSGLVTYECKHDSCADRRWQDFRAAVGDPTSECYSGTAAKPVQYAQFTCAELVQAKFETRYLVDRILVAGQPCILAGPKKSLKTSLLLDLGLALARGGYFLGHYPVPLPVRVGLMTGESGLGTIQETILRIARACDFDASTVDGLVITESVPRFGEPEHDAALHQFITGNELSVVVVDPAYMAIGGEDAGNLMVMGNILGRVNAICSASGCTLILAHHSRKNLVEPFAPLELEDIAWSGFQEFTRQWILLNRRRAYDPGSGSHKLWFSCGGSAGHGFRVGLDIEEGSPPDRFWQVDVLASDDIRQASEASRKQRLAERQATDLEAGRKALVQVLVKHPAGETKTFLRDAAHISGTKAGAALASLIEDGNVVETAIIKGNRRTPTTAYRLSEKALEI